MNKKILVVLIMLSLATFACSAVTFNINPPQTVRGSGNVVSETRAVSGFSALSLEGSGDVDVTFGNSESAVVEADDNIAGDHCPDYTFRHAGSAESGLYPYCPR